MWSTWVASARTGASVAVMWSRPPLRPPPLIVAAEPFTGWLGLLTSWMAVGFGAGVTSRAAGVLSSLDDGACGSQSSSICQTAGWSGLAMGVVALMGGTAIWLLVARGFGPPVGWWVLPISLAAIALAPFAATEGAELPLFWSATAFAAGVLALALAWLAAARGKAARYGWIRLDGLDAREAAHRRRDKVLLLGTTIAVALGGGRFGVHVLTLLADAG